MMLSAQFTIVTSSHFYSLVFVQLTDVSQLTFGHIWTFFLLFLTPLMNRNRIICLSNILPDHFFCHGLAAVLRGEGLCNVFISKWRLISARVWIYLESITPNLFKPRLGRRILRKRERCNNVVVTILLHYITSNRENSFQFNCSGGMILDILL